MKKIVFLALIIVVAMCSCENPRDYVKDTEEVKSEVGFDYKIIRIDNCQYIEYITCDHGGITRHLIHKGDCDYRLHWM